VVVCAAVVAAAVVVVCAAVVAAAVVVVCAAVVAAAVVVLVPAAFVTLAASTVTAGVLVVVFLALVAVVGVAVVRTSATTAVVAVWVAVSPRLPSAKTVPHIEASRINEVAITRRRITFVRRSLARRRRAISGERGPVGAGLFEFMAAVSARPLGSSCA
jgi:hypothetical protein